MGDNNCVLWGVVGNPDGAEGSGICWVLCLALWDSHAVPLHEKGGLELMVCVSHPIESPQVFTCSTLGCQKRAGGTGGGSIKPLAHVVFCAGVSGPVSCCLSSSSDSH